jgi:hypothetical protein
MPLNRRERIEPLKTSPSDVWGQLLSMIGIDMT